jgi:hypothetical protein
MKKSLFILALATILVPAVASAKSAKTWAVQVDNGSCFSSAAPTTSRGDRSGRTETPFTAVSHRPAEQSFSALSFSSGFKNVERFSAEVSVDNNDPMKMLTYENAGFVKSGLPENDLLNQMLHGRQVQVVWTKPSGERVTDIYSLNGFANGYREINKACGYKGK